MAYIQEHEEDCVYFLGKPYSEVHLFLDQYAKKYIPFFFQDYHRTFLHNTYGLVIIRAMYGVTAQTAGKIHIVRDYLGFPKITQFTLETILVKFKKIIINCDNFWHLI